MTKSEIDKYAADVAREITVTRIQTSPIGFNSQTGTIVSEFYLTLFNKISEELKKSDLLDVGNS